MSKKLTINVIIRRHHVIPDASASEHVRDLPFPRSRTLSLSKLASLPKQATFRDDVRTLSLSKLASLPKQATFRDDVRTLSLSKLASLPKQAKFWDDAEQLTINLPDFTKINYSQLPKTVADLCQNNLAAIKELLEQQKFNWHNLLQPIEELNDQLHNLWETVEHLYGVNNNAQLRTAYQQCIPIITDYYTQISHNKKLYQAIKSLAKTKEHKKLNRYQKRIIANELRDFKLSGIALDKKDQQKFAKLQQQLALLTTKFSDNVLDATQAWNRLTADKKRLSGIPKAMLTSMQKSAKQKGKQGWLITLDQPTYLAIMTYADDRKLRKTVYTAFVTRASSFAAKTKSLDNAPIIKRILKRRQQIAALLNYENYAQYSLIPKAAKSTNQVLQFLTKLAKQSKNSAVNEYDQLQQFGKTNYGITKLQPWDITYIAEKLKEQQFNINEELLRPYFPESQVINGFFKLSKKLFSITIKKTDEISGWHKDVKILKLYHKNKLRGIIYLDLYARKNKQNGAWMHESRTRRILHDKSLQIPIAYIITNFSPPIGNKPALLTHNDVETLFHEFGHALQHVLTTVNYSEISGINGIPWDVVELPSQFMENWCWQKPVIDMISKHYKTGKKLSKKLFDNMLAAKNFQSGLQMLRQIELALFDMRLHLELNPQQHNKVQKIIDQVRKEIAIIPQVTFNKMQNSFLHIFAGGYDAGYYSYKWAEVLSADAFAKFEEYGLFNPKIGESFLRYILEAGGSEDAMQLFRRFRGRKPKIDALLRHSGIKD